MARAIWSGSISFGLVNIPVKLHTAVRDRTIHFHLLSPDGTCRLRRKLVCPETGEEFEYNQTTRGYEVAPDQYILIKDEELDALRPQASRTIDIQDFVELDRIDPIYYDRTYYLTPEERGTKAYRLLYEAMTRSGKVAVAKFVMRNKEYLAALRPMKDGLVALETMHFAEEIASAEEVDGNIAKVDLDKRELDVAQNLIEALVGDFKPEKYRDEYREQVMELIERKTRGEEVVTHEAPAGRPERVINLMDALQKSLAAAREQSGRKAAPRPAAKRKSGTQKKKGGKKSA